MNTGGTTQFFSRFGLINSVKTLTSIKKDEEFFVNYKYAMNNSPKWYRELYKKFASENPGRANQDYLKIIEAFDNYFSNNHRPE